MTNQDTRPRLAWDRLIAAAGGILSVLAVLIGAAFWLAHLEGGLSDVQLTQSVHAARLDRVEQNRTADIERIAKTEEAVSSLKELLTRIDEKISRILLRGR